MQNSNQNSESPLKYLLIDGVILEEGTEADLVNLAAQYDSDYEILEEDEISPDVVGDWKDRLV